MKKMVNKKKAMIIASSILGVSAIGVGAFVSALVLSRKGTKEIDTTQEYEKNNNEIIKITSSYKRDAIELTSLKKSLKMSLDLCRGGVFDVSEANITGLSVKNLKAANYSELVTFIDKASIEEAINFNNNFTKIKFIKKFAVPFNEEMNIKFQFNDKKNTDEWLAKTKDVVWNWGVKQINGLPIRHYNKGSINDFDFFSHNDKNENQFNEFVSQEDWNKYFRYQKQDGTLVTFDEVKKDIYNSASVDELENLINKVYVKPVVCFNLIDKFLIKFFDVKDSKNIIENNPSSATNNVNVNLNGVWDPIFGLKNSWFQFKAFQSNYFAKNAISPMFLIEKSGTSIRDDGEEFYIYENEILNESINYSMPQSYEQIINYKSSEHKFNNGLIPINEKRYYENKLHEQQTPDHGFIPMSDVDMYNETMTGNWYPHIRQEYPTMWQYISKYVQWGWKTTWPTPLQVDTAHKNGAEIFGTWFNDSPSSMILRLLADTEENRYVWADNFIQMMKDTGVDGMLWNAEVSGWSASGISEAAWKDWNRLLNYLNVELEKAGKKLLIHPLHDSEIVKTPDDWIEFLKDGDDESDYRDLLSWRLGLTPANGESDIYHYDNDYSITNEPLGYAHKNGRHDIWLGFIDKPQNGVEETDEIQKYGPVAQARERAEFVKNNPQYNLITLGSDSLGDWWNGSVRDYIGKEMKFLKDNHISDQYYGDYSNFAEGAGVVDYRENFEWEMAQYVSRTNDYTRVVGGIPDMPGVGYTTQNDSKFREPNEWFGKGDWEQLSQDPRSTSGAYSNYFQERSTIDDRNFYTAFNVGYGHHFTLNGKNIYNEWQNIGFQDFYPSYRYLIDVYDANGNLINDSSNNYAKRKVNAYIDEVNDAYQGDDALHYKGTLNNNEAFVNKLYVSNIAKDKEFSIFVKNDDYLSTTLQVWRNKNKNAEEISASKTETVNGYKKLTFNVQASDVNKITSFGLKVKNTSSHSSVNLENYRVGAISFKDPNANVQSHSNAISNYYAETNNIQDEGINVKFDDKYFGENTRYVIYDENNLPIAISSRPEFHVTHGGNYKIKVFNPIGESLGETQIYLNELKTK